VDDVPGLNATFHAGEPASTRSITPGICSAPRVMKTKTKQAKPRTTFMTTPAEMIAMALADRLVLERTRVGVAFRRCPAFADHLYVAAERNRASM